MPTIQEDAPHPQSYRPDIPLRPERESTEERLRERLDLATHQRSEHASRARRAEHELEEARKEIAKLKGAA